MEVKESECAVEDVISSMPDIVITHILDRLPVQDAVKTGILSKNWRFKWTMLSRLVFDEDFYLYLILKTNYESKFGRIISRLLLHLRGAITKFVLYIDERCYSALDDEDIASWFSFLSRKGVKDLTVTKTNGEPLNLPSHLFSCLELKHLKLFYCRLDPPVDFRGFPNLLSLESGLLHFESSKFGEFITQCPLLEILNMRYRRFFLDILNTRYQRHSLEEMGMDIISVGKVKLAEIANAANIKILSVSLCDTVPSTKFSSIFQLVGLLPKLHKLNLDFVRCKDKFTEVGAKKRFLTTHPCLKTLTLSTIDLCDGIMLSCALELIRNFPNVQTLEITATRDWDDYPNDPTPAAATCSRDLDNDTMGLLQLQSAVFTQFKGSENEVYLIKYLLACSPFLKKLAVKLHFLLGPDEELIFARKLLKLHRASPIAEIKLS
ncbi:F-box/FBD/LRR-repeat protein At1g13570-like isoform X2 [Helianthus annuus]|uniref:F-box/FBD/LRR-repeat protein At1g13570-like isoform X2 n=1 Tax=Helianthus annuus TaxID=4232 RepID=UPI000B8FEC18|nr:F-box/FBD/LRR-repeat protein At1g13570-like isoform X2 [Helianthus annuus]